jgi:hypothetical protein
MTADVTSLGWLRRPKNVHAKLGQAFKSSHARVSAAGMR